MAAPLAQLTRAELEFLRRAIARKQLPTPISQIALQSIGKGKLFGRLGALIGAPEPAALALIDAALGGGVAPAAETGVERSTATLVWTGPDVHLTRARPTTAVLRELLGAARQHVLIAGYELNHGAVLFEPLHKAMTEHGVTCAIHLDIRPAPSPKTKIDAHVALAAGKFLASNWPFGPPTPALYYYPDGAAHGSKRSMHAKCVVVDGRHVLVGSANFTRRGHTRNVEVGVRLDDPELAAVLTAQFERLVEQGDLAPLQAAAASVVPVDLEDGDEEGGDAIADGSTFEQLADELFVSAEARPLFLRALAAGLVAPLVGEDIAGDGGGVLGSPELAWPDAHVAVLLPEQEGSRKRLEAADWTCFGALIDDAEFVTLCDLVNREG